MVFAFLGVYRYGVDFVIIGVRWSGVPTDDMTTAARHAAAIRLLPPQLCRA